jgi:hypothetical protein
MKNYKQNREFTQDFTLVVPEDCLRFDSKFESGNLKKAIRVSDFEYNLYLDFDTESLGYTQWFYFSVKNKQIKPTVRFNIMNFVKYDSLYNKGMKPAVFSVKQNSGWTRDCSSVAYYKNSLSRLNEKTFFTLTFSYTFKEPFDEVFFAYSFPYTYSDLQKDLENLKISHYKKIVRIDSLCTTLAGNEVPVLTITKEVHLYTPWEEELEKLKKSAAGRRALRAKALREKGPDDNKLKRCVFVTARVHPGETNGSFMMKGFLQFITGNSSEARLLRKNFVFKVVPMLNPDGVVYGNYRCSLLGVDLNRRWNRPNKIMHPEIYYCKRLIQMLSEEKEITLFCDMHGHSIKKDVFMYGCRDLENLKQDLMIKIIPFLLSKMNKTFSYPKSFFRVGKDKTSTGRAVCFQELKILNSYTMEASFFGPSNKAAFENKDPEIGDINLDKHFDVKHLQKIGKDFGKILTAVINSKEFNKALKRAESEDCVKTLEDEEIFVDTLCEENEEKQDLASLGNLIDENVIEELGLTDCPENYDCSDSEGSENDDKKIHFKKEKQKKARKTKMKRVKSVEVEKDKILRKTVTSLRRNEANKHEILKDFSSKKKGKNESLAKIVNTTPDSSIKISALPKTTPQSFRSGLKFAAAVALPKESTLFKGRDLSQGRESSQGREPGQVRDLSRGRANQEKKVKVDNFKNYDFHSAKIKFKQVVMNVEERRTFNNFKYII